ncbi:MAG TPA: hypothetical protein VGL61_16850 [Kofleriaceae bacterium]|jgi:hypothetical protein
MSKQKTEKQTTTTTNTTDERKQLETLVDEILDGVLGGMTLCEHCNQPCGDCTQPSQLS